MRRALIVGIDNYDFSPLKAAVNDAVKVKSLLKRHEYGGVNFDCKLLINRRDDDPDKQASERRINRPLLKEQIYQLFSNDADVALLYFSGHGEETDFGGFLVTQDAYRFDEGVSLNDIITMANKSKVREIVIILDCCYSGKMGNSFLSDQYSSTLREGISIISSSRSYQTSAESAGHGHFTRLLCEALEGEAADILGNINVAGIYHYIEQVLNTWEQRPVFKSNVSSMLSIRKCYSRIPLRILRKLPEYFSDEDSTILLGPEYEINATPDNHDKELIYSNLLLFESAGLVTPVDRKLEHLSVALEENQPCKLTRQGQFYYKMAEKQRI